MSDSWTTSALSLPTPPSQLNLPTYQVTRASDLTLIYDPPVGSQQLSDALSCHYPFHQGLQQKLRQASIDFLISEQGWITEPTLNFVTPLSNSPTGTSQLSLLPPGPHTTSALLSPCYPPSHTNQALQPTVSAEGRLLSCPVSYIQHKPWDIKTGKTFVRKPRKRTGGLEASERQRIAKNRGSVCERHRKSRTRVCSTYKLSRLLINLTA